MFGQSCLKTISAYLLTAEALEAKGSDKKTIHILVTESPRPLEVKGEVEFLLRLYKGVGLITTCLRPIMVQELKEGEKQYKRWKKRR